MFLIKITRGGRLSATPSKDGSFRTMTSTPSLLPYCPQRLTRLLAATLPSFPWRMHMIFLLHIPVIMLPVISTPDTGFDREIPNRETILFLSFKTGFPEALSVGCQFLLIQQFPHFFHLESSFQSVYYVRATDCTHIDVENTAEMGLVPEAAQELFRHLQKWGKEWPAYAI